MAHVSGCAAAAFNNIDGDLNTESQFTAESEEGRGPANACTGGITANLTSEVEYCALNSWTGEYTLKRLEVGTQECLSILDLTWNHIARGMAHGEVEGSPGGLAALAREDTPSRLDEWHESISNHAGDGS